MKYFIIFFTLLIIEGAAYAAEKPSLQEIEQAILESHNAIVRGQGRFVIQQNERVEDPRQPGKVKFASQLSRELRFAFDVPKFRVEEDGQVTIRMPGKSMQWSPRGDEERPNLRIYHTDELKPDVFDPRLIAYGTAEVNTLYNDTFQDYFGRTDVVRNTITGVENGDLKLWRAEMEYARGSRIIWVDPTREYSIVRTQHLFTRGDKHYNIDTHFELQEVNKRWFPLKIYITKIRNGFEYSTVTVAVEDLKLNTPVDQALFEISSMGVEAGAYIQESPGKPGGAAKMWDGQKIAPMDRTAFPARRSEANERPGWHPVLLVVSILTAVLSGLYAVFYIRSRRRMNSGTGS